MRKHALILAFAALLCLALAPPAHAQWTNDPISGMVTVCDAPGHQWYPRVCNLAGNRTFVAWYDERTFPGRIYYQVLDPSGNALLQDDGMPIVEGDWGTSVEGDADNDDAVIPDGLGGCIMVFWDERDGSWDVYGQRVDSLGNRLWGAGGIGLLLWPGPSNQDAHAKSFCADSLGNFFCSSIVAYNSVFYGIYIQKFYADGTTLWGPVGAIVRAPISGSGGEFQETVPDMVGGVIDVWEDYRFSSENATLYFQHLDADGNPLLPLNGIPVRNSSGQVYQGILDHGVPDGQGGGIWARTTASLENWFGIFRLNGQGQMLWEWTTGNPSMHGFGQQLLRHPADGTIWFQLHEDVPGHHGNFLYRFNVSGRPIFGNAGLLVQGTNTLIAIADGIIDGDMLYHVQGSEVRTQIWSQRFDRRGRMQWNAFVALGRASPGGGPCFGFPMVASDGADGAVFAFEEHNTTHDIAAQRVLWNGRLGAPVQALPAAEEPLGELTYSISAGNLRYVLPTAGQVKIELFDLLGRRAALILETFQNAGQYAVPFDDRGLPSGTYFLRLTTPAGAQTAKVALVR